MARVTYEDLSVKPKEVDLDKSLKETMLTIEKAEGCFPITTDNENDMYCVGSLLLIFSGIDGGFRVFDTKSKKVVFGGHNFSDKQERRKICDIIYNAVICKNVENKKSTPFINPLGLYGLSDYTK